MAGAREFTAHWKSVGVSSVTGDMNKVATATGKVDKGLKKVDDSSARTKRRLSEMNVTLKDLAKAGVGLAAGKWLGGAVVGAAKMETSMRGVSTVLGDVVATDIAAWAKANGDALNISQQDALAAASSLASYAASVGEAGGNSVTFTSDIITLSSELAAMKGVDPAAVIEAVGGAMRGEFDTLQTFGINVNAATVEAKALEMGLAATTAELTDQDKLMATYAAVMEEGGTAMGFTADNADTLSVKMADLKQKSEDLQTAVGGALVGPLSILAGVAGDLATAFGKLPTPVRLAVIAFGGLVIVRKLLGPAFSDFGTSLKNIRTEMQATKGVTSSFKAGFGGLVGAIGPWNLALSIGVGAISYWMGKQQEAKGHIDALVASLNIETGAYTDNTRAVVANALEKDGVLEAAEKIGIATSDVVDAVLGEEDARKKLNKAYIDNFNISAGNVDVSKEQKDAADNLNGSWELLMNTINSETSNVGEAVSKQERLTAAVEGTGTAASTAGGDIKGLKDDVTGLKDETTKLNTALGTLIDNYSTLKGDSLTIEEATVKIADGMDGLAESVKENGTSLDEFTEKGARNRLALGEIVDGTDDLVTAMIKEGATHKEVAEARRQGEETLRRTMRQAGFTKDQIDKFVESVKKTPRQRQLELSVIFKKEKIAEFNTEISKLKNQEIEVKAKKFQVPPGTPGPIAKIMRGEFSKTKAAQVLDIEAKIDFKEGQKDKLKGLKGDALIKALWPKRGDGSQNKITGELDEAANPGGKPRDSKFKAFIEPNAYNTAKAELDKLAEARTATVTVNTVQGVTSGAPGGTGGTGAPGAGTGGGTGGTGGGGGGGGGGGNGNSRTVIQSAPRKTPVVVLLDGQEISTHLQLKASRMATVGMGRRTA